MSVYDDYEVPAAQGTYFKFEDGKTVRMRISSDPAIYDSVFTNKATGKETTSTKYGYVVWNYDAEMAQVLQIPGGVFKTIQSYARDTEYGNPQNYDFKITRTGTGFDTNYDVKPSPTKAKLEDLAPGATEKVLEVDLIEMLEKGESNQNVMFLEDFLKTGTSAPANVKTETAKEADTSDDTPGEDGDW